MDVKVAKQRTTNGTLTGKFHNVTDGKTLNDLTNGTDMQTGVKLV